MPKTLYDKIWDDHLVFQQDDGTSLLYVDRHLVHEVTSPQAFEGLRLNKRKVRKPNFTLAVADHTCPQQIEQMEFTINSRKFKLIHLEKIVKNLEFLYLT